MRSRFDLRDWTIRRGMLLIGVLLSAAIAAAVCLPIYVVGAIALLWLLLLLLPSVRRVTPFFCLVIVLVGLWRGSLYRIYTIEAQQQLVGICDTIEGVVEECPQNGHMYSVRITDAESVPVNSRILLYCSDQVAPSLHDTVTATVEYKALYRSQQYRRADSIYLQAFPTTYNEDCVVSHPSDDSRWLTALRPFRAILSDTITSLLNKDEGGLLAAVCLGDRSYISEHVSDVFRASGLSHLLSVSGLHMSVIAGGMLLLMRSLRIKRVYGNLITAVVILLFMWLVEFTPSVTRAGVMYLVLVIGQMTRYQSDSLNSLGLALTIILLVSPASIFDVGLWLSFAATVGILCITPRVNKLLNKPFVNLPAFLFVPIQWLLGSLSVSIGCTLPTVPLLLVVFGEISLVSPLSNLLAVLPAGWMTVCGCLGSLISTVPLIGFIGKGMLLIAGLLAKWLITVSEWCSAIPGAVMRPTSLWMIVLMAGAGILLSVAVVRLSFRQVCSVLCVILSAFIVALPISAGLSSESVTVTLATDDNGTVIVAQKGAEAVVMADQASGLYTARRVMDDMRAFEPQLIIVNSCKTQHEAYLADWKREYPALTIASCGDICEPALLDHSLNGGDRVSFWGDCSLLVLSDEWWLFSVGDTSLLFGLSSKAAFSDSLPSADAVLVYEAALTGVHTVVSDVVFCVSDSTEASTENVYLIKDDEPISILTDGDGLFRWLWRPRYVLE